MLLNQIKNENSRFSETHPDLIKIPSEFEKQIFHQTYFKTPLAVNNCVESMLGPTYADQDDYGVGLVASELMTFSFLLPSIREKGGAYGAGCKVNESGLIGFYSFRDPKVKETYDNFEKAVNNVLDGNFGDREMQESKLLAFQKLDKVLEPSLKGLIQFTRGYSDEDRLKTRLRALDCSKEDIIDYVRKYMVTAIEDGSTSRVVFGSQGGEDALSRDGWSVHNPMDFLSNSYFEKWNEKP